MWTQRSMTVFSTGFNPSLPPTTSSQRERIKSAFKASGLLLFGIRGGCLGETCAIALIIGFVYLVVRRVITPTIPLVYVATIALMSVVLGYDPIYMILTGGVLLGGIFMLTDYSTSPATEWGKVVFALGAGIITMLIRNSSGGYPEGVSFAILLMNIICPHLNKIGAKKPFGVGGAEK